MISIKSLNKFFNKGKQNEIHVINNISLELPEHGMVALFGRSGCGKTTLLNTIGGLDSSEGGSVLIDGENIERNTDVIRNKYIGYIFQNYNLNKNESNFDNVADALRLCGMTNKAQIEERVMAALANVGMDKYKSRTPDMLSGGQMQRIAIARAIVKNPKIILADEPTGNLDEANTIMIMDLLKKISEEHLVVLVTHEAKLVDYYCDKVIELSDGKIMSVRDNQSTNGYAEKNKNDIYLGEFEKKEINSDEVNIEYYGAAPSAPVSLRIVNDGKKIYLSVNNVNVHVLDETSEVKLRQGVYTETEKAEENRANIDMSKLPPIDGSNFGRLFRFKGSVKSGYTANFKKNKRSTKALRVCMFLFSIVLVFMSASLGTAFKQIEDVKTQYNQHVFYVHTPPNAQVSEKLSSAVGKYGIDNIQLQFYVPNGNGKVYVSPGKFESFQTNDASFSAFSDCLDIKFAGEPSVLAGRVNDLGISEIVITDTLADNLIKSSTVGYVKNYNDIIGLYANYSSHYNFVSLRIVGVIRSDENCIYRSSLASAKTVLNYMNINVRPNSYDSIQIKSGETAIVLRTRDKENNIPEKGQTLKINGKTFTVKDIISPYNGYEHFLLSIKSDLAIENEYDGSPMLLGLNEYMRKLYKAENPDLEEQSPAFEEGLQEYTDTNYYRYYEKLYEKYDEYLNHNYIINPNDIDIWLYVEKGLEEFKYFMISDSMYYFMMKYRSQYGIYPTLTYMNKNSETVQNEFTKLVNGLNKYYNQYNEEFNTSVGIFVWNDVEYILTESDYNSLADGIGESHESIVINSIFDLEKSAYTVIHSSNVSETERYLKENFDINAEVSDSQMAVYTPDYMFDLKMESFKKDVTTNLIVLAVFLAVMCFCMYFIMRSSLMSRIKEVGIYRAIGVSKINLTFKFLIEAAVLTTLTVFVGYIISSAFIFALASFVSLLDTILYYPFWLAGAILIILYAVCLVCGIIPITALLRKTPSQILSKYDI